MANTLKGQEPGAGWSNGDIQPMLYASSQAGKLSLYGSHRRWIGLQSAWTRVSDQKDPSAVPDVAELVVPEEEQAQTVRCLVAQLCEKLFFLGWATGTSGAVSLRVRRNYIEEGEWRVFVTPSGMQKEDMIADDIFEMNMDEQITVPSETMGLRLSACTSLWFIVYRHRPSATCVIHTHSMNAVIATLLDSTEESKSLKITNLEMLKGVGNHQNNDILEIPIIDNRPTEGMLCIVQQLVVVSLNN